MRFRLHDDPEYAESEAAGVVQAVTDVGDGEVEVVLLTRRGRTVRVRSRDVSAARLFIHDRRRDYPG